MKTAIIAGVILIVLVVAGVVMFGRSAAPAAQNPQAQATTTGANGQPQVQGQDVTVGSGAVAQPGSKVSVLYEGKFTNGTVFDSSAAHGNQPLSFVLGEQSMILGFQVGVNGMREGGERIVQIPPALAYGTQDVKDPKTEQIVIPGNSTLVFDIKLVKVEAPVAATSTAAATTTVPASAATPKAK